MQEVLDNENKCLIFISDDPKVIYLRDDFETGNINQECIIPPDLPIVIPSYTGECDTGSELGFAATSEEILKCALDADKGVAQIEVRLDNNEIVNMKGVQVGQNINTSNLIEVQTDELFEVNVTKGSQYASFYEKPGTYLAHAHGFLSFLPNGLPKGNHTLEYSLVVGGSSGGFDINAGYTGYGKIKYDLIVK